MSYPGARGCSILAVVLLLGTPLPGQADQQAAKVEMRKLLDAGWQGSLEALRTAEEHFDAARKQAPGDVRAYYAMAVVAIKHHQYRRAEELISQMRELRPGLWIAEKAHLWLLIVLRNYDAALSRIAALSAAQLKEVEEPSEQRLQQAKFLGRMYGFLEGPAADDIAEALLRRAEQSIEEGLHPALLAAFREGRDVVLVAHAKLDREQQETLADAKEQAAQVREQKTVALKVEGQQTAQQAADLDKLAAEMQQALQAQLAKIDDQLGPLRSRHAELLRQADLLLTGIRQLQIELDSIALELASLPPDDFVRRDQLLLIARRYELELARQDARYRPVLAEGRQVEAAINQLAQQRNAEIAQVQAQLKAMGREKASLEKRLKRVDRDQLKLIKSGAGSGRTPQVRAQEAVIGALNTYEPFPVEQEKQTILKSLAR